MHPTFRGNLPGSWHVRMIPCAGAKPSGLSCRHRLQEAGLDWGRRALWWTQRHRLYGAESPVAQARGLHASVLFVAGSAGFLPIMVYPDFSGSLAPCLSLLVSLICLCPSALAHSAQVGLSLYISLSVCLSPCLFRTIRSQSFCLSAFFFFLY